MSLSAVSNMRQNRNPYRPCSADRDPSLRLFAPQTSKNRSQNPVFQQPVRDLAHSWVRIANQTERYAKFIAVQSAGYARSPDRVERDAGISFMAVHLTRDQA
jgi:hypothetical protein